MVDTARDYRLGMALHAVAMLERRLRQWGLPWPVRRQEALALVEEARKRLLRARYSFLPAEMLAESEEVRWVSQAASRLREMLLPEQKPRLTPGQELAFAEIRWALLILYGLPARIRLGEENRPEWAVDVVGVEVVRVEPLAGTRLMVTRASAGAAAFTIVTNIQSIRPGEARAAALLPPAEFSGVVSEAMYASGPIEARYVGRRVPSRLLSGEVAAAVRRIVEGR
ncbi:MAG: RNA-binding protein [Desulfurococcales archaeon]|nr:RNA-binding protein [Desulfurococcales archaeon]